MSQVSPINWASVSRGAYATHDCNHLDNNRDRPLTDNVDDTVYQCCPSDVTYTIHLLSPVLLNTFVVRLYYSDCRAYTFSVFETSTDGVTWTEVIPADSKRSQTFKETFPARMVSKIRLRGSNSANAHLHVIRFQAFYVPEVDNDQIPLATAQAVASSKR